MRVTDHIRALPTEMKFGEMTEEIHSCIVGMDDGHLFVAIYALDGNDSNLVGLRGRATPEGCRYA
ncbi:hypothetical protein A4G99_17395 [Haladaptatus sp. R4]|uniref:hypothetical protein n=1 Tax=Haladaptatus sp. R4 TaxID=1679489 RepID=UPI0007B49B18|nr:hypothetical protein [Haladaptatus sp. R4]KZN22875.1 hypothetical protein A4G99_17395 [Haladaptatus sp. R4]